MKPGRNDPCYCGSGKKVQQLSLEATRFPASEERRHKFAMELLMRVPAYVGWPPK
jgi:hypothetical protein